MTMNVNNNPNKPLVDGQKLAQQQQTTQQQNANNASTAQTQVAQTLRQDSVSLTSSAQQLSQLQKKAGDTQSINQEKVDKLKKAIQNGE